MINISTQKPRDFNTEVARGNISGSSGFGVTGISTTIGTTETTISKIGTDYTFPTSAAILDVVSTSANDTSLGTGARTVSIEGLDSNFDVISETVILNGTTIVNTTNSYMRVNQAFIDSSGSLNTNDGTIDLTQTGDSTVLRRIAAGDGRDFDAVFTVPNNISALLTSFSNNAGKDQDGTLIVKRREFGKPFLTINESDIYQNSVPGNYDIPFFLAPKSDTKVQAISTNENTKVSTTQLCIIYEGIFPNINLTREL